MKLINIQQNMTVIVIDDKTSVLFSYETPVAAMIQGKAIKTSTYYSRTTTKHINKWLRDIKATEVAQECLDLLL